MQLAKQRVLTLFLVTITCLCDAGPASKTQQLTSPDQVPEGLAKSDWSSICAIYEAGRHAFQPIEGGWEARNSGQQWTTKFDGRGFVALPKGGGWQWGLELKCYGFPGAEQEIKDVSAVQAEGKRLTYSWDAVVSEWFVNDTSGLEHGFTVKERPAKAATLNPQPSTLNFTLAVRGSLATGVTADGQGTVFCDDSGATVLTYSGLKVWDADGKILSSHFAPLDPRHPSLVTLVIDERAARYPLTIDPIAQQAYLKPAAVGTAQAGDVFGSSVAVSGDTVVVGAYREDGNATEVNGTPDDALGFFGNSGAAYVFVRSGTIWSQQAYLKPAAVGTTQAGDEFGISVDVWGDTVVVGARGEDGSATGVNGTVNEGALDSGAAYVFVRSGTNWSQEAYLKASQVSPFDSFGFSVAVAGDTVVVGARFEDSSTTGVNSTPNDTGGVSFDSGAAYVFVRSGTTWSQQAYLKASQVSGSDNFGISVAVSGDTLVVGANNEDGSATGFNGTVNEGATDSGAVYVFVRSGTSWSQEAYLKASQVSPFDSFGFSVAVAGDTVVVGAVSESGSATGVNGTADESAGGAGAAYVFVRSGMAWSQQAYLKASQVSADDQFGRSVAVAGDTVVVGAIDEDGSAMGVNGTADEDSLNAGAAYIFVRSGTNWSQKAYLKASQVSPFDSFGWSVAVEGDTVVVGSPFENGSATGVNGMVDKSAGGAGAAYIFTGIAGPEVTPFALASLARLGNGSFQFGFTNGTGLPFTVLTSTNVALPLNLWSNLGPAVETPVSSGQYQFTDPQATSNLIRFYRVSSP